MPIKFNCLKCGRRLGVPDDRAGRRGKCPGCGAVLIAPGRPSSPIPGPSATGSAPRVDITEEELRELLAEPLTRALQDAMRQGLESSEEDTASPRADEDNRLLEALAERAVDARFLKEWAHITGAADAGIERLLAAGVIQLATPSQMLNSKCRVPELKALLTQKGAKATGKKADLIARLLQVCSEPEAKGLVEGLRLYCPTPSGEERIRGLRRARQEARQEEDRKRVEMERLALSRLRRGDLAGAGRVISEHMSWQDGMPQQSLEPAAYLLGHPYADLPLDELRRREVGSILALSVMLCEPFHATTARLLDLLGGRFSCPPLKDFLRSAPSLGVFTGMGDNPDDPNDLAMVYAHTRIMEARVSGRLKAAMKAQEGAGLEFLHDPHVECSICNHGPRRYRWSDIEAMPRLPRHWGCRCVFLTWRE